MAISRPSNLWSNLSFLLLMQGLNFLLTLILIPFTLKRVGAANFGVIAVAQAILIYLSVMVEYGFNRSAVREVAISRDSPGRLSQLFSLVIFFRMLFCFLLFLLLFLLMSVFDVLYVNRMVYYLGFSFVVGQALSMNWFFQGMEKMKLSAITAFSSRVIFTLLVFLFIRQPSDTCFYLFFMGSGNIIVALISLVYSMRTYKLHWVIPTWLKIWQEIKLGWPYTLSNLSMSTMQNGGVVILRIFSSDLMVGYYSIAEKIYIAMKQVPDIFSQVAFPRVCILFQEGREKTRTFFRTEYLYFLGFATGISTMTFMLAPWILSYFFSVFDPSTVVYLRYFCIVFIVLCLNIPSSLLLQAGDQRRGYMQVFTLGILVWLLSNFLLANYWNALGTVLAAFITELFISVGLFWKLILINKRSVSAGRR